LLAIIEASIRPGEQAIALGETPMVL
jgi:hypothetical protein